MQIKNKLADGLWHIEKFLPDHQWEEIKYKIIDLPGNEYQSRYEPMRNRLEILNPTDQFYQDLANIAIETVLIVSKLTKCSNLRNPPGLFLWRDFIGFKSHWHPDDFTHLPTAQIYVDGNKDLGTSFIINDEEITIPFEPNTGYLMDNKYQIVHGMLNPVREKIRQSIYLIY
jgi:hypothetical protein